MMVAFVSVCPRIFAAIMLCWRLLVLLVLLQGTPAGAARRARATAANGAP